jgi:hypothetical protein
MCMFKLCLSSSIIGCLGLWYRCTADCASSEGKSISEYYHFKILGSCFLLQVDIHAALMMPHGWKQCQKWEVNPDTTAGMCGVLNTYVCEHGVE